MMQVVRCGFCSKVATRFFLQLNGDLWTTCERHDKPFLGITIPIDLDEYELDTGFEDDEPEPSV